MPNILTSPRFWDKKAVILKAETSYGTDAVPTGAANYIEARNVSLTSIDIESAERNIILPTMGSSGKINASLWAKLSFEFALAGSGAAGTAPKWAPAVMGCGFAETVVAATSATYNLVSSGFSSLTAYLNIDGVVYKFVGARGELKCSLSAKGIPMATVELQSVYATPVAGAMPALTKTGWAVEEAVNAVNTSYLTVNGVNLAFSALEFSTGNQISRIDLPGPQREVAIVDRSPQASATVLAPDLATFNPYTLAEQNTAILISNTHGSAAGKKVKADLKGKIVGIGEDQVDGLLAYRLSFSLEPVAGNDEITLANI
jgi:hypothetical protein